MSSGEPPPDVREDSERARKPESPLAWLHEGTLVRGRYELLGHLGSGSIGSVFSARHLGFDEAVALKFLQPRFLQSTDCAARFMREARTGFKLRSEHIARVFDIDAHEQVPFIAMEMLDGSTLRTVLKQRGALPHETAVDYALQICEALATAHALGLLHLDVEPGNVFLVGDDHIKLVDFGLSQVVTDVEDRTAVRYMAPERFRATTEPRVGSDIWSLGCVLYELLSGQPAFQRSNFLGTCAAVLGDEPIALTHMPDGLWNVLARCLQKTPEARFLDVAELAAALAPFGSGRFSAYPQRCRAQLNVELAPSGRASTPPAAAEATVSVQRMKLLGPNTAEPSAPIQKSSNRKATLAFDVSAFASPAEAVCKLDAMTTDKADDSKRRQDIGTESPATVEEMVRDMRPPSPAKLLLVMAALACMVWSGVALLSAPQEPEPAKLMHLVTPLQK